MVLLTLSCSSLRPSCRCLQFPRMHPEQLVLSVMVLLPTMPTLSLLDCKADHAAPHSSMLWTWCSTVHAPDCTTAGPSASLSGHFTDVKHTSSFQFFTLNLKAILGVQRELISLYTQLGCSHSSPSQPHFRTAFLSLKAAYVKMQLSARAAA